VKLKIADIVSEAASVRGERDSVRDSIPALRYRRKMDPLAAGFWGAFFGTAGLMFAIALAAWVRSRRRVALILALSAVLASLYVVAHLGWLPFTGAREARVVAHVTILAVVTLSHMLLSLLGFLRQGRTALRGAAILGGLALAVIGVGWLLEPAQALALAWGATFGLNLLLAVLSLRIARHGNTVGRMAAISILLVLVALGGLSWIGMNHSAPWPVHAASALAATGFLALMAVAAWTRYSYLLELSEVMAHGPNYDPVTRMRSHSETGQLVSEIFFHRNAESRPIGVIAICVGNLYALENLHGRAAFNHALFVCAGRLRRCVPQTVEMGRLGEDGFLLVMRNMDDIRHLGPLARQLRDRLSRPVSLSVSRDLARIDKAATDWEAEVGIGVLVTSTQVSPSQAISTARAMSRTAWSYPSRLAYFDRHGDQIAELPADNEAAMHSLCGPGTDPVALAT
jgi:GGDEF domain-containing protein